ncbi:MAG: acyl-CoA/acyl-ACP dehydrogenase [Acidimicrobiia bacterium]|nr:acyl-CoA/acyl-ACP dehydrogenase [Acidimicrobiia bacterium]
MNFAFSEEQEFLRETARRFLDDKVPSVRVRDLMDTEEGYDPGLWADLAGMGWQAMAIPEKYGGAGFTFLELAVLLEEMGRSLLPAPFLSSVILGANTVLLGGNEPQKESLLGGIASGELLLALAVTEPNGKWDSSGVEMQAEQSGDGWVLSGSKSFVIDGHVADTLIVAARTGGTGEDDGISLFVVAGDASGVERSVLDTMDQTRKMATISFTDVSVGPDALLGGEGVGWPIIAKVLEIAAVALAVEQVGGAQKVLDMAVDYAKVRMQFGRPIGSFQAIKHKCADMLVAVESAKSAAYYAAWAVAEDNDELPIVSHLAKSYCSEAFFSAASENIQIHGGIGFTWEHDAHLYFKRAKSSELMFGDPAYHRAILADRIGI